MATGDNKRATRFCIRVPVVPVVMYGAVGLVLAILLLLFFGNPQWHKWIYLIQYEPGGIMPDNYTGVWRTWADFGVDSEVHYRNGKRHRLETHWFSRSQRSFEGGWRDGLLDGHALVWYRNGQLRSFACYRNGQRHGPACVWLEDARHRCQVFKI